MATGRTDRIDVLTGGHPLTLISDDITVPCGIRRDDNDVLIARSLFGGIHRAHVHTKRGADFLRVALASFRIKAALGPHART